MLASGYILEVTVFGDDGSATLRVSQIPGFVKNAYNSFGFGHSCPPAVRLIRERDMIFLRSRVRQGYLIIALDFLW